MTGANLPPTSPSHGAHKPKLADWRRRRWAARRTNMKSVPAECEIHRSYGVVKCSVLVYPCGVFHRRAACAR